MKIAQIVCVYPPYKGGMGAVVKQFNELSEDEGRELFVFTPDFNNEIKNSDAKNVFRLKPLLKYGNAAFLPQLLFRLKNFDVVCLHYPFFGTAEVIWLAKCILRYKFSLVIHYHMDVYGLSFFAKIFSLPSKFFLRFLVGCSKAVTCASFDYTRESQLSKLYKKHEKKFYEIPFGVDTTKFFPKKDLALRRKSIDDRLNILFVGGLDKAHHFKGVDVLLRAVSALRNKDWKLNIVGRGELLAGYKELSRELDVDDKVRFWDNVSNDELPDFYRKSDLFVLPSVSRNEAFGLVLLEAMSSGVPVIASNLPGVRKVFRDNVDGFLVDPGNVKGLERKIDIFFKDKSVLRMGLVARELVLEKYSLDAVRRRLNNLYRKIHEI